MPFTSYLDHILDILIYQRLWEPKSQTAKKISNEVSDHLFLAAWKCTIEATGIIILSKPEKTIGFRVYKYSKILYSYQIRSVAQLCLTLCNPMNRSTPGLPVHHQLPEFTQTPIHRVSDAIKPSNPLSSPSPPAPNLSQHHRLFQWVNSSHEMAQVLEFQL